MGYEQYKDFVRCCFTVIAIYQNNAPLYNKKYILSDLQVCLIDAD